MSKIVGASKITTRFQITLPEEAREILKVSVGDTLAFIQDENGKIYITAKV
jgi:AbrB family looped-hinge helix DNA binding protein